MYGNTATLLDKEISKEAKMSVYIFLAALGVIVLFSLCQICGCDIRPNFATGKLDDAGNPVMKPLAMNLIIQIVMIAAAAFMILLSKAQPKKAVSGVGFLDHMLTLLAAHGHFDLDLSCKGDTNVDYHHSVEDIGIALGQ